MRIKVNKLGRESADKAILIVLCGIFLTPIYAREILISSTLNKLNIIAFCGALLIFSQYLGRGRNSLRITDRTVANAGILLFFILGLSELHAGRTLAGFTRVVVGLLMPLLVLYYQPWNIRKTFSVVVDVFTVVTVIAVSVELLHTFTGVNVVSLYYMLAGDENYFDLAGSIGMEGRIYSFWGHPLYNAQIFLSLIGLNYIYGETFLHKHKRDLIIVPICVVGVALTASKSAIAICMLLLILLYTKNKTYMSIFIVMTLVLFHVGLFDLVISRFGGSLSTGRDEIWQSLQSARKEFFHFFWGNGSDSKYKYENIVDSARAAFEYPFRLFALEFGILFDIIIMGVTFLKPVYTIFKIKPTKMFLIIIFVAVSAHVNIYNGIGTYSDQMYAFCLFGCMVIQAAKYSLITKK